MRTNESPFNWQGKPSIFTTGRDQSHFTGANYGRSVAASEADKKSHISLPGGSKELPPKLMRKPT